MPTFDVIQNFVEDLGLKDGAEHDLNSAIWYAANHVKAKEDIKDNYYAPLQLQARTNDMNFSLRIGDTNWKTWRAKILPVLKAQKHLTKKNKELGINLDI